jgi:hypothetical protein
VRVGVSGVRVGVSWVSVGCSVVGGGVPMGPRFSHLEENNRGIGVGCREDVEGALILSAVERLAHLLLELLPLAVARDGVDDVDEDRVEDRLCERLQWDGDGLLLRRHRWVLHTHTNAQRRTRWTCVSAHQHTSMSTRLQV